jgi:amiloride-sensitive sodium channel
MAGLIFYTRTAFIKLNYQPDIGVSVNLKRSSDFPFPAITICSGLYPNEMQKYDESPNDQYEKNNSFRLSIEEQNRFAAFNHVCAYRNFTTTEKVCENRTEINVVKMLQGFEYIDGFYNCWIGGKSGENCDELFTRTLTDAGICKTFNMLSYHEMFNSEGLSDDFSIYKNADGDLKMEETVYKRVKWTLTDGYKTSRNHVLPMRSYIDSIGGNLLANVSITKHNIMHYCDSLGFGYRFIFHLPNEIPTFFHQFNFIDLYYSKRFTISAKSHRMSQELRKFSANVRECYFEDERKLKFFKSYTKTLCEYECVTNYTLKACGCVKFNMPRTNSTPVCDIDKISCYRNASLTLNNELTACNCLATCNDIQYVFTTNQNSLIYMDIGNAFENG